VFVGNFIAPGTGDLDDARGLAIAPNGDVYVADFFDSEILHFNSAGAFVGVFASGAAIQTPFDLSFGPNGNLYVGSSGNDAVIELDAATGTSLGAFTSGNPTPIGGPHYMVFGPELIVTDIAGHVFRFDAATGAWIATGIFDNPEGVAFDASNNLYIAQRISDNVLRRVGGPAGAIEEVIAMGAFAGSPADLVIGPDGLLYLASSSAIYRFDVSGAAGVLVDSFGSGGEYLAFTPIPEPGTFVLVGAALVAAACRRRAFRR
jgi:DNA-binding beta-propeller fold protein YncE